MNEKLKDYREQKTAHEEKVNQFASTVSLLDPANFHSLLDKTKKKLATTEAELTRVQKALDIAKNEPNSAQTAYLSTLNQDLDTLRQEKRALEAQLDAAQANPPARESRGKTGSENKKHSTGKVVGIALGSVALVSVPLLAWLIMQNQQLHKAQAQQAAR